MFLPRLRSRQAGGLLLCATSRDNLPPALVLELLLRVARVVKARFPCAFARVPFLTPSRTTAAC